MAETGRKEKDLPLVENFETVRAITADGKSVLVPKSKFGGNLEIAKENVLGGVKASPRDETDTQEVKIDPNTGRLYCPPSEMSIATSEKLGGIVADAKTAEETEEVKIDPSTGKLYVHRSDGNPPDEEDITLVEIDGEKKLQFNDKSYDSSSYSGLGRTYLRKNMVNGVNVLTQAMFANTDGSPKGNTRYIIQYDYDLNGATIKIPEGCVLDFEGGSVSNGVLVGNFTTIKENPVQIFGTNLTLDGTWNVEQAYSEWFGAKGDGVIDDAEAIQKAVDNFNTVILLDKSYAVGKLNDSNSCIKIPKNKIIKGSKSLQTSTDLEYTIVYIGNERPIAVLELEEGVTLSNFSVKGCSRSDNLSNIKSYSSCIKSRGTSFVSKLFFDNIETQNGDVGFDLQTYLSTFKGCQAHNNNIGFYIHGRLNESETPTVEGTSITMTNCYCINSHLNAYRVVGITYSTFINLAADSCGHDFHNKVVDSGDINPPYMFRYVRATKIQNCGAEISLKYMSCSSCQNVSIDHCHFTIGWHTTDMYNPDYLPENLIALAYSNNLRIVDFNFNVGGEYTSEMSSLLKNKSNLGLFYIEDGARDNIRYHFYGGNNEYHDYNKNIKYGGSVLKKNVYIEETKLYSNSYTYDGGSIYNILTSKEISDNPNRSIDITLNHSSGIELSYVKTPIDLKGKTINIYADNKVATAVGQPGLYIKNGVLNFKGLNFTASDGREREALFNCTNARITTDSCKIYNIGTNYTSGYICTMNSIDSHIMLVNTICLVGNLALAPQNQYTDIRFRFPEYNNNHTTFDGSVIHHKGFTYTAIGNGKSRLCCPMMCVDVLPEREVNNVYNWDYTMTGITFFYKGKLVSYNGTNWVDSTGTPIAE